MPIFQADIDSFGPIDTKPDADPELVHGEPVSSSPRLRRLSEESLRTELCEGPIPDSPPLRSVTDPNDDSDTVNDREDLIHRLKRAQSPTWIPNRHFESILHRRSSASPTTPPRPRSQASALLPPAQITPEKPDQPQSLDDRLRDGLSIERPRSALHSGDFTHDAAEGERPDQELGGKLVEERISHDSSWAATSPPRHFVPFDFERRLPPLDASGRYKASTSPLSSSISSFVYQPPTSPLVQSESNDEQEISSPREPIDVPIMRPISRSYGPSSAASSPFPSSPSPRGSTPSRLSLHRREGSLPYQAHQPRRSLTGTPNVFPSGSSPSTPAFLRSRRQSFSSDFSPLQHASMVGSYEESILRGRMSTTPSKPLDFLAQIGVLGKGKCKASLRCPPHVTLPFPAVYYSYSSTAYGRSQSDDGPSPYVGQIDLENGLPNPEEEVRLRRKAHSRYGDRRPGGGGGGHGDAGAAKVDMDSDHRPASRSKRRIGSPKAPPGGSYRIPEKGQIQIIIKNPNKTAVKLFLVPYDLAGMEPGTKTFIRQRSYSTGPIIDNIPSLPQEDPMDRPVLRYLVHLHICSPSKGRFYLYKSIRIVFANRVPDGKEKLRNETTWPEPRFSPYKPIRVMHPPLSGANGPGATLTAEKALRRRSLGFPTASYHQAFDMMDGVHSPYQSTVERGSSFAGGGTLPVDPMPFHVPSRYRSDSDTSEFAGSNTALLSPESSQSSGLYRTEHSGLSSSPSYEKLNKGDLGYGGNAFGAKPGIRSSEGGAEGLLSQRLRSLGVKGQSPNAQQAPQNEEHLG